MNNASKGTTSERGKRCVRTAGTLGDSGAQPTLHACGERAWSEHPRRHRVRECVPLTYSRSLPQASVDRRHPAPRRCGYDVPGSNRPGSNCRC
eukprot:1224644-Prymnesium_polylepis.1